MMRRIVLVFSSVITMVSQASFATGVDEWHSMQNWNSGVYQVYCKDGSRETLSTFDLLKNNTCPKLDLQRPNGILSLQQTADRAAFTVICADKSQKTVSALDLASKEVCVGQLGDYTAGDITAGLGRADGRFDLLCDNGSREIVTPFDFRMNNVCPRRALANPGLSMGSAIRKADGTFDVICTDRRPVTATAAQVLNQSACAPIAPEPVAISVGVYQSSKPASPFCATYRIDSPVYAQKSLVSLRLVCGETPANYWSFSCQGAYCQTEGRSIKILGPKQVSYTRYNETAILTMP